MTLSKRQVEKVANLAKLQLGDEELQLLSNQLANIVTFVEQLDEVNTEGVEPMAHPLDIHTVLRSDRIEQGLSREEALANAPNSDEECFLVPPVL